ncbi:MAG: ArsR/SmtB family transcription factor [Actinomycetota bacterium]
MGALADPTRRAVFEALERGPRSVGDIAAELPVSRPAVSQHLRVLKGAGLVVDERAGNRRLYRLEARGLAELHDYVERFWDVALRRFKEMAETNEEER